MTGPRRDRAAKDAVREPTVSDLTETTPPAGASPGPAAAEGDGGGFAALGLSRRLVARLAELGLDRPTPIQAQAIPALLSGRDVVGLAQTGTGKTAAFGLPLVQTLERGRPGPRQVRALVLAPTRELARQIEEVLRGFTAGTPASIAVATGGPRVGGDAARLARGADILVATPGRLLDLLGLGAVELDVTRYLVLDEADRMLDLGFLPALKRIAAHLPRPRQTMLFSATMPPAIEEVAATYLTDPLRIAVSSPGRPADRIDQDVHFVSQRDKAKLLETCLAGHRETRALVFVRTKASAAKLARLLVDWGFAATAIHGDQSQSARDRALAGFRSGDVPVLVATDLAARGLDIPEVGFVYNYDLPETPEPYVHRIGRTARAGAAGRAVAFCAPAEMANLRAIEKAVKTTLRVAGGSAWKPDMVAAALAEAAERRAARLASMPRRRVAPAPKPKGQADPTGGAPAKPKAPAPAKGAAKPAGPRKGRPRRSTGRGPRPSG